MQISRSRITTISFDVDGTLLDFKKVMRLALGHVLAELRKLVPTTPESLTIDSLIAIRDQTAEEFTKGFTEGFTEGFPGRAVTMEEMRFAGFQRALLDIGIKDDNLATHLNDVYFRHRYENVDLFNDVLPALDVLGGQFQLGVISNGNSYPERCGLEGRFQFVVFSQDHAVEKPTPKLFEIAMQQAACTNNQLMHVGDSLGNDVGGAKGVGAWSVWLNREGHPDATDLIPNFQISALTELKDILDNMG